MERHMKKWNRLDYATLDFTRAARDMVDSVGGGCPGKSICVAQ